tara:strand:- start:2637 stop:3203 length:567 start_codon:yes stop_codon:yes gene_type:complete
MTLSDRILATILATLLVWAVTKIVTFFIQRSRIKAAFVTDLKLHQRGIRLQDNFISSLYENGFFKADKLVPFPIRYASEEWLLYRALQRDLAFYLSSDIHRKVIKFYHLMWELDQSMLGFAQALDDWDADGYKMTQKDVDHLKKRIDRMHSMAKLILEPRISRLSDLPEDYQQAKTIESIIPTENNSD